MNRLVACLAWCLCCGALATAIEVEPTAKEHTLVRVKCEPSETVQVLAVQVDRATGTARLRVVETHTGEGELVFTGPPGFYTLLVFADGKPAQPHEVEIVAAKPGPGPVPPTPPGPEPGPTPGPDVPDELGATGARLYPLILAAGDKPNCIAIAVRYRRVLDAMNDGSIKAVQVARTRIVNELSGMVLQPKWADATKAMEVEAINAKGDIEALKKVFRGTIAALELAAK